MKCCPDSAPFIQTHRDSVRGCLVHHCRCLRCFAQLPLGPANADGPHAEAVAVEKRAAELAAHGRQHEFSSGEWFGWLNKESADLIVRERDGTRRHEPGAPLNLDSATWRAGYLAREIVAHETEIP